MESTNPFNLEKAIQTWKNKLQKQGFLTSEDIEELSNHLEDEIEVLVKKELSAEEAFWVAQKRLGNPAEIGEAFEKAQLNSFWLKVARTAIVILSTGLIISSFIQILSRLISFIFLKYGVHPFADKHWIAAIDFVFLAMILGVIRLSWFKRKWLKTQWEELLSNQAYTLFFRLFLIVFIVLSCDALTLFKIKIAPHQLKDFSGGLLFIGWNFQIILLFVCVAFLLITTLKGQQTSQNHFVNYLQTCSPLGILTVGWISWMMVLFFNFSLLGNIRYFNLNITFPICVFIFHSSFGHILQKYSKLIVFFKLSLTLLPFIIWCILRLWVDSTQLYEYPFWLTCFSGVLGAFIGFASKDYCIKFKFF